MREVKVSSAAELDELAQKVATKLKVGDIVSLAGPLAAGKTTFVQHLLRAMGYAGPVNSPTFVIEHRYPVTYRDIRTVLHLDLYRLNEAHLKDFDWPEYLEPDTQVSLIEWPEKAASYLPYDLKTISIEIIDEKTRRFQLSDNLIN